MNRITPMLGGNGLFCSKIIIFVTVVTSVGFISCSESGKPTETEPGPDTTQEKVPSVQTTEINNITTTTARGGGTVVDEGTSFVTKRGVCWSTEEIPTTADQFSEANSVQGSGDFPVDITNLDDNTTYFARAFATSEDGTGYGEQRTFTTRTAQVPVVETHSRYTSGTEIVFVSGEVSSSDMGYPVTDKGICWSTKSGPEINDASISEGDGAGSFLSRVEGVEPETIYYVRAYASNEKGTSYGQQIQVETITPGDITYTLHKESDPSGELQEHYSRIEDAFENAEYYYEQFTSITKELNVHYNPDVVTADGNINGTIRVGANSSYQQTGTAMHEIMHTVGVGQHWMWNELIEDGNYQGTHANTMLQIMTQDTTATIYGDGLHFWPYGINGAHEDTGEEMLYIIHALIMQGMKKDGLPSSY